MAESVGLKKVPFILSLLAGLIIVIVSIFGFSLLRDRRGIPKEIDLARRVQHARLVRIDDADIQAERDEEFVLAWKAIGEPAAFYLNLRPPEGKVEKKVLPVVPYYAGTAFPVIYFVIGLLCLVIGAGTFLLKPEDLKARLFYWLTLAFASALIISGDNYCLSRAWPTFIPCLLFILAYAFAPAFLLHFSLTFSKAPFKLSRFILYVPAICLAAVQVSSFLYAYRKPSIEMARFYNSQYFLFRLYVIFYFLLAIISLSFSYKRSPEDEERAQIKWIFYGLAAGLLPFLFLYQLPSLLKLTPILSEEISQVFFIAIPIAFAIAIIKYKLMHIELVINRSLVYSLLTVFTVGVYLLFVLVSQKIFSKVFAVNETLFSVIGVFLAAAAFHPAQRKFQDFVDRAFFRQKYDYRRTILAFNEKAQNTFIKDELLDNFFKEIRKAIPVERLEIISRENAPGENRSELTVPLMLSSGKSYGFLTLGRKKSGERYTREDIELLRAMAGGLAVNLDRIRLQEEVIYERASKEKLDELNRLKTEFISTVSHELRTPMSSIQGLAEILQSGKIESKEQGEKYLNLMASECSRLSRLLHNILDFGRIEQQAKLYHYQKTILQDVIQGAADVFGRILESQGFRLTLNAPEHPVFLEIDGDAVKQALINLIDNAVKYSTDKKIIDIELIERENEVEIRVKDQGIGIPQAEQKKIFESFYRVPGVERISPKGAGLGLKIIKHIMQAHGGNVLLESEVHKGSTFRLIFPKL